MSLPYARIDLSGTYDPFDRRPEDELDLINDIWRKLGELGLHQAGLLYSGFSVAVPDSPASLLPSKAYVMTETDWRETATN